MDPRPRDCTDRPYMPQGSDEELFSIIQDGGAAVGKSPAMMAFEEALSDDDIQRGHRSPAPPLLPLRPTYPPR
jgi:hypothetical protein